MIVVNFATNQYAAGQERLKKSLEGHDHLIFSEYHEIGSPSHHISPYEFKIHAIEKAFEHDDIVLWCDSSLWLTGDLSKIEKIINTDGYFFEEAGHYCGRWCNQHTRNYFQVKPEEMEQGPGGFIMFSAGLVGLNLKSEIAMQFFYEWKNAAKAGCFKGSWIDHRHDMVVGSIIASRLGMKYQTGGTHLAYIGDGYVTPNEGIVFKAQGI
jgi:hypothetical protein